MWQRGMRRRLSEHAARSAQHSALPLLCLIAAADACGYAMVLPILPLLADRLALPTLAIGLLFAAYSGLQLLAAPVLGALGDRYGIRPVLLLCLAGSIVGFALLFDARAAWLLFLSRLVDGATAGNVSLLYGAVLRTLPERRHAGAFAALAAATSGGILVGLVGAALLVRAGFDALVLTVVLGATAVFALTAWRFPRLAPAPAPDRFPTTSVFRSLTRSFAGKRGERGVRRALAATLLAAAVQAAFLTTLPLLLERLLRLDAAAITRVLVALFAVAAAFQLGVFAALTERLAARWVAAVAFALTAVGGAVFAAPGAFALAGGAALVMGGCALLGPALTTLLGQASSALPGGATMGVNQAAVSLGQIIGPIAGYAALAASPVAPRLLILVLALGGVALLAGAKEYVHVC